MADPQDDDIPTDTTWGAHMRTIRREQSRILETLSRTNELLSRLSMRVDETNTSLGNRLAQIQSDIVMLENQNLSRHGEVIGILERLDRAGIPSPDRFGLTASSILVRPSFGEGGGALNPTAPKGKPSG